MNDGNAVADATDAAEVGSSSAGTTCKSAGSDAGAGEPKLERVGESRVVDSVECRSENRRTPVMHG